MENLVMIILLLFIAQYLFKFLRKALKNLLLIIFYISIQRVYKLDYLSVFLLTIIVGIAIKELLRESSTLFKHLFRRSKSYTHRGLEKLVYILMQICYILFILTLVFISFSILINSSIITASLEPLCYIFIAYNFIKYLKKFALKKILA